MSLTVLICGGRGRAPDWLNAALDAFHAANPIELVIHGDAIGVDRAAGAWARSRGIKVREYPANWAKHGFSAGPRRNAKMLAEGKPHVVLGFPGGTGTAHMLRISREAGTLTLEMAP